MTRGIPCYSLYIQRYYLFFNAIQTEVYLLYTRIKETLVFRIILEDYPVDLNATRNLSLNLETLLTG